jgi:1-acyl-sn-glycerol-3-phosphate acyltransferase
MNKFYKFLYFLLSKLFRVLYRIRVEGLENEPEDGALLICANHTSFRDILVLAVTMRHRQIRFCAKAELFKVPVLRHLIKALGAFPLHRGQADTAAFKTAISMLESGESVGLFPQGTRYAGKVPEPSQFRNGAGMIAYRAKANVLPVLIYNKGFRVRPFRRTYIKIGTPIAFEELGFVNGGKTEFVAAAGIIANRICDLLPDSAIPAPTEPTEASTPVAEEQAE